MPSRSLFYSCRFRADAERKATLLRGNGYKVEITEDNKGFHVYATWTESDRGSSYIGKPKKI